MSPVDHIRSRNGEATSMRNRLWPVLAAFIVTLAPLPGHALQYPDVPLQSGSSFPPANMMFVLDDSASMGFIAMPGAVSDSKYPDHWTQVGMRDTIWDKSYVHNTLYYNPAVTYQPWLKPDGSRYVGGTSYDSAYRDIYGPGDEVHLGLGHVESVEVRERVWENRMVEVSKGYDGKDVEEIAQTYFVPSGTGDLSQESSYIRYQIRWGKQGSQRVLRVEECTGTGWGNCRWATPEISKGQSRSEADEIANFATWYSYHRTRMKTAKAGASEAFSQVGENIRMGFNTIWNRSPYPIPVATDAGLFRGGNKASWYEKLFGVRGESGTPLHGALQRTGDYYKTDDPWKGENGELLSCRQNFAILTTDGYWNNDEYGYDNKVGDADGTAGPNDYEVVSPYRDNFSTSPDSRPDTLADVAMHYWKTDLRSDLEDNVPSSSDDPAEWQHMVTFGISIGLKGTLEPTDSTLKQIADGSLRWPDPIRDTNASRIDDLWHASVNGHGGFLVASNTKEFTSGVLSAINTVAKRQGSASNVATNSTSFTAETRVYQATYMSAKWTGELAAYDATSAGVADTPAWEASTRFPAWDARKVFTWNGSAGTTFPTSGSGSQTELLDKSSRITSPVSGADNANYIKGDTSKEKKNGGDLRDRDSLLGDIVNSSPVYVKDVETVFVGANDGMLHAFAAITSGSNNNQVQGGAELFAYVPGAVNMSNLASLSDPNYQHRYFVDGPIVVSSRTQTPNKNYLVGALGRGGKGVFGLDVTNPKSFAASNVKWELTSGNNIGQVLGEPIIVTLNDANKTKAVIFGNGINSANGRAVLYVVNIATGAVIQTIDTGVGDDNGLSAPRGWDDNGDGAVDYVYAGDLKGNIWKFDFTGSTGTTAYSGSPMFASGQAITAGLALAKDPASGKRWVFAGTGRFITAEDPADETVQSVYGLIDDDVSPISGGQLTEREIVVTGTTVRAFQSAAELPSSSRGWFVDLGEPTPGERVISRPQVRGKTLIFSSIIPPGDDPCDAGGSGYINAIDAFTGTSTGNPFLDGSGDGVVDDADQVATENGEKLPVGSVDPGIGMPTLATIIENTYFVGGSEGGMASGPLGEGGGTPKRTSWREIVGD